MYPDESTNKQPLRELGWLAHYFEEHSREDLAQEIFEKVRRLRQQAQESLQNDSNVVPMKRRRGESRRTSDAALDQPRDGS